MLLLKRLVLFFLGLFLSLYLLTAVTIGFDATKNTAQKSDAIVVLGAKSYRNGGYNPCLEARVSHAVSLYKKGLATNILMTGGTDKEDGANEAETMKKIAVEQGIDPDVILLEKESTSTYENFLYSKPILDTAGLTSTIIVTEPFHIKRATLIAGHLGYDASVSPAVKSPCWTTYTYFSRYFLKEPLAIGVYYIQSKL